MHVLLNLDCSHLTFLLYNKFCREEREYVCIWERERYSSGGRWTVWIGSLMKKEWLWLWRRDNETKTNTDIALRGLDYDSPFPVPEALNTEVHAETPKFTCPLVQQSILKAVFLLKKIFGSKFFSFSIKSIEVLQTWKAVFFSLCKYYICRDIIDIQSYLSNLQLIFSCLLAKVLAEESNHIVLRWVNWWYLKITHTDL